MLQLFFAVAFTAAPLALHVPRIRCLNLFVENIEQLLRQSSSVSRRLRHLISRFFSTAFRTTR
ncbi:hypothetical protein Acr_12g0007940 [Actinidia rufa]|uniref:Secreted protein n=1 Tax=Actinidia rufa TaxID=165716 RepID=A0A7J0FI42_9ERIC|nr:hypothetical protein Acr_12g0007940 [Actinidia rufa]